ncbi:RimK family alpha-L-glutamate ligase [Bdellovibrionota bacterium FG-2]
MRLAILSRNKNLHSIRRLLEEARRMHVECSIIDPLECQLVVNGKKSGIYVGPNPLPRFDAILPRIGTSITDYGLAVVKQFEALGMYTVNGSASIAQSRDKMRSLQILTHAGLRVPPSVLTRTPRGLKQSVERVGGLPVVMKLLRGTQGVGVMLVSVPVTAGSVFDTLQALEQDVIIQQFIAEGAGRDYRVFVIGEKVVGAMMRTAPSGEFRSNLHRGGEGSIVKLPLAYERAAIRAAKTLGVEVAGVDIIESKSGPLILEVNSSPGFEGIESATGLNIAGMIVKYAMERVRRKKRRRGR